MGLNVDEILGRLGRQKTAEEKLAEGLSEKPTEVKVDIPITEPVEEKKAEEISTPAPVETVPEVVLEAAPVTEPVVTEPVDTVPVEEPKVAEIKTAAEIKLEEAEKAYNEAKAALEAENAVKTAEAEKLAAEELEKVKEAEETGRIMARGFHDELNKLASVEEVIETPVVTEPVTEVTDETELTKKAQVLVNLYNNLFGGTE